MSKKKLIVFETHPIQYRAPVYQALELLCSGEFEVVHASDFSVRGYRDAGFGSEVSWDIPLLSGYCYRVLGNEAGEGIDHWRGLSGRGVDAVIKQTRPDAILLNSFGYAFCWAAYWAALRRGIPVWIRMETQDEAVERGHVKSLVRSLIYRIAYLGVRKAFYIGELSREHLLRHGIKKDALVPALYCTPDPIRSMTSEVKQRVREALRDQLQIPQDHTVVAFFGKLIPKKDPALLFDALGNFATRSPLQVTCLFVGSGELEGKLRERATKLEAACGIRTVFAGFVNQSKLPACYLASDVVVLPSRRAGETWGLVVNEALQAGCGVVVSDAVGCHRNFGHWERVRVIPVGGSSQLAAALTDLIDLPRDFDWASERMATYSVAAAAAAFSASLQELSRR